MHEREPCPDCFCRFDPRKEFAKNNNFEMRILFVRLSWDGTVQLAGRYKPVTNYLTVVFTTAVYLRYVFRAVINSLVCWFCCFHSWTFRPSRRDNCKRRTTRSSWSSWRNRKRKVSVMFLWATYLSAFCFLSFVRCLSRELTRFFFISGVDKSNGIVDSMC